MKFDLLGASIFMFLGAILGGIIAIIFMGIIIFVGWRMIEFEPFLFIVRLFMCIGAVLGFIKGGGL